MRKDLVMSPVELERLLESCSTSRRQFLRNLILGTAYATPLVTSFTMDDLGLSSASASIDFFCPNTSGGSAFDGIDPETGLPTSNVVVRKTSSPDPVSVGDLLTFTVEIFNCSSAVPAIDVVVTDPLPAGTVFQSTTQISGPAATSYGESGGVWEATFATLDNTEPAVFEIVVLVQP